MRPMFRALVPGAQFQSSARMSKLHSFGRRSLKALPPRSVVVAFSMDRVYELAESLRRLRGGVAVVLGALSPRTRNAQVAMYQSGEVQYLVATDAIGMGLNLDVNQVAFAETSKFDGTEHRELRPDELAQIAGRAGRHLNDGSFGTLNTVEELAPRVLEAIESHRFAPVQSLIWRNRILDFATPEALLDSLSRAPGDPAFIRVERADDFDALKALARLPDVRALAADPAGVERLWHVCQIPDFRKRWFGQHVTLLREIFLQLSSGDGRLAPEWLERQVSPLDDVSGDLHTLMDRLASVRVWTYISHRAGWLGEAARYQERTRRIEDALGDALHARLVERFVEKAARRTPHRFLKPSAPSALRTDSPFAKLRLLVGDTDDGGEVSEAQFVEQVVDAHDDAFHVDANGRVSFEGEALARLVRGKDRRSPLIALTEPELWTRGAARRLERRLMALARDLVIAAMGGFRPEAFAGEGDPPESRGLAYRLEQAFGVLAHYEADDQWALLDDAARDRFQRLGLREGHRFFYLPEALTPFALERRCLLTALYEQTPPPEGVPREPTLSATAFAGRVAAHFGYHLIGPTALRMDVVERLSESLRTPQGAQMLQGLHLDGTSRTQLLRELGPHDARGAPPKHRHRRRRRKHLQLPK